MVSVCHKPSSLQSAGPGPRRPFPIPTRQLRTRRHAGTQNTNPCLPPIRSHSVGHRRLQRGPCRACMDGPRGDSHTTYEQPMHTGCAPAPSPLAGRPRRRPHMDMEHGCAVLRRCVAAGGYSSWRHGHLPWHVFHPAGPGPGPALPVLDSPGCSSCFAGGRPPSHQARRRPLGLMSCMPCSNFRTTSIEVRGPERGTPQHSTKLGNRIAIGITLQGDNARGADHVEG